VENVLNVFHIYSIKTTLVSSVAALDPAEVERRLSVRTHRVQPHLCVCQCRRPSLAAGTKTCTVVTGRTQNKRLTSSPLAHRLFFVPPPAPSPGKKNGEKKKVIHLAEG